MPLTDQIALITGGATGIGRATAELFAARGAKVLIVDYNEEEGQAAVQAIEAGGGKAAFFAIDVRSEKSVAATMGQIRAAYDHVDTMVCSAGVLKGAFKNITDLEESDWDATIDTNLKGTYLTVKYAAPLLAQAGQSVLLLIASGAGVRGASSSYAYAASKAGMHGMHFKLETELGPKGTRIHVICPGGIATPLKLNNVAEGAQAQGNDPEAARARAAETLGDPMGVARILAFLAAEEGSYVRGTIFTR
ncbi:MAG: SDR family NAD(P)-dependent oxidoreductase [Candidatus Latescibacteria bacterium]|nr:SDR family NAD(P)-dependent oxidoreductase [Candidatus Latescibacterota bacterium]